MSGSEIAALIVAITTAVGAIFAGVRNLKGDKIKAEVEAAAAVLTGYTNLTISQAAELDRIKAEHLADRKAWAEERAAMRQEHSAEMKELREELREVHQTEMLSAYERIDELGAQVYALQHRPPETRDREGER